MVVDDNVQETGLIIKRLLYAVGGVAFNKKQKRSNFRFNDINLNWIRKLKILRSQQI